MGWVGTVVDAAIGWVVQGILDNFFTEHMQVWTRKVELDKDVEKLESEMRNTQMMLTTAKGKRIDNKPLSDTLDELKGLLYDAEDVMDELDYYRIQQHIKGKGCNGASYINPEGSGASSYTPSFPQQASSVMNRIISWTIHGKKRKRAEEQTHSIMLPPETKHDISERINEIVNRLCIRRKSVQEVLQLETSGNNIPSKQTLSMVRRQRLTTSIPIELKVYGRDEEKDIIIEKLVKENSSNLGVLPLVGIGGVGKTTLARFVYHDQRIKDHFGLRMWVCVSDNFNEYRLTHEMLEHVCRDRQDYENIINCDVLQKTLLEKIRHKRFLLVLDDIWEDVDRSGWKKLLAPLKCNEANGCMILATTRRTSVATMMGTMSKVEVNGLNETDFWKLFKACAFSGNENLERDPALQSIGKQIAQELMGNPLAARTVGALLNRNVIFEHWRKVQDKWKSLLGQDNDSILSILKFSYEFLPIHLQRCFSYCSLFPKDHQFTREELVHAWMSQNFVHCECHTERLEETGKKYLDDLVDCGFFEEVESHYVMHDLMHDLAKEVSSNECASIDGLEYKRISPSVRHLSIITTAYEMEQPCDSHTKKFENILQNICPLKKLRTLMFFGQNSTMVSMSLKTLCKESNSLRFLSFYGTAENISSTLELLKPYHLRYLKFIHLPTENIYGNTFVPQALTQFYHLQVLDARCEPNIVLPTGMNNLINLRYLAPKELPSKIAGVGNLTSLQELKFKVQDADNFNIGQLRSMNELITLQICQLENVQNKEEAKSARLIDKECLEKLSLSWEDSSMSLEPIAEKTSDVLEGLEAHQNLRQLKLTRYSGTTSPTWLTNKVTSLQTLCIKNCREWRIVQSLEMLPGLRSLELSDMWNLMEISIPSYLENLVLVNMPKLEKGVGIYKPDLTSGLRVLVVKDCPVLNEFTLFHSNYFHSEQKSWFPSLTKLTIEHCHHIIAWTVLPLEEMGALKELELMDVPVVEELTVPSLEELVLIRMHSLQCCSGITALPPLQVSTSQVHQEDLLSSLRRLTICGCPSLIVSLPMPPSSLINDLSIKGLSSFPTMEIYHSRFTIGNDKLSELDDRILSFHNLKGIISMSLESCGNLTRISAQFFSHLVALKNLTIWDCPNLQIYESSTPNTNDLVLSSLKTLMISSCGISGRWLTKMLSHLHSLEDLHIRDCPQIKLLSISQPTETEASSSLASEETTSARDEHLQIPCNCEFGEEIGDFTVYSIDRPKGQYMCTRMMGNYFYTPNILNTPTQMQCVCNNIAFETKH